jgi:hypothetical protein
LELTTPEFDWEKKVHASDREVTVIGEEYNLHTENLKEKKFDTNA